MGLGSLVEKLKLVSFLNSRAKRNVEISLAGSIVLRANIFLPAGKGPWPVVLSVYPYMKDGVLAPLLNLEAYQLAQAGYAAVQVDLPGIGSSGGVSKSPFQIIEDAHIEEIIDWCSRQDFSDGNIGMLGESFGGMSALSAAAKNPPALKAVFSMMAPGNFYPNLVYPGGSLNMLGLMGSWINLMNLIQILPPFNHTGLKEWNKIWQDHLAGFEPFIMEPTEHTILDTYWKNANITPEKITIPVYMLDGWNGFSHSDTSQMFSKIPGQKKLMMGPWVHMWPSMTDKEPADYMKVALRWFDYWLKGIPNGIMDEPSVSVYFMGKEHWRYEENWPPSGFNDIVLNLRSNRTLGKGTEVRDMILVCAHDPTVGLHAGLMTVLTLGIDYPKEQSPDDAKSVCFTTSPIPENLEIAGEPRVTLTVSTDMPDAAITVRLCDIDNEENSRYITRGWLRLSKRDGLDKTSPVEPGVPYTITIPFMPIAYRLEKLHSLRVSIQLSDFPRIFPLPYTGSLSIHFGPEITQECVIPTLKDKPLPTFKPTVPPPDSDLFQGLGTPKQEKIWEVIDDLKNPLVTVKSGVKISMHMFPGIPDIEMHHLYEATVERGKPETAKVSANAGIKFQLAGKTYTASSVQTALFDKIEIKCDIHEFDKNLFSKTFTKDIKWL
ncbi:MAG: hypothetical protein A2Y33_09055 [Spirochaetes bacterium GWF1_51_8]|nr:MAG: hypothetical protein A2Y33_09055 [Spirochaetes bacterium GWF1_51_8]